MTIRIRNSSTRPGIDLIIIIMDATHLRFSQNSFQHTNMEAQQRLTLQSNPLRFGRYLERNQSQLLDHAGAYHKSRSDFYLYRPFKMWLPICLTITRY
jgi:hypothetical protein